MIENTTTKGTVEVNGGKLYYEVTGEGHPLVLIHSMLMNHKMWDEQVRHFSKKYKVITYDQRGYGQSEITNPINDVKDLYELLKFLNVDKVYLLGLSMGAELALNFVLTHPEKVEALILSGSGVDGFDYESVIEDRWWEPYLEDLKAKNYPSAIERFLKAWMDGKGQAEEAVRERARGIMNEYTFAHYDPELKFEPASDDKRPQIERLDEIQVPTLIIYGNVDQPSIPAVAEVLATKIAGAKKVMIPDTAHFPNLQKPDEFNQALAGFLAQI